MNMLKKMLHGIVFVMIIVSCAPSYKNLRNDEIPMGAWRIGDVGRVKRDIALVNENDFGPRLRRPETMGDPENWNSYVRSMFIGNLHRGVLIKITRCYTNPKGTVRGKYLECEILNGSLAGEIVAGLESIGDLRVRDTMGYNYPAPDPKWVERVK